MSIVFLFVLTLGMFRWSLNALRSFNSYWNFRKRNVQILNQLKVEAWHAPSRTTNHKVLDSKSDTLTPSACQSTIQELILDGLLAKTRTVLKYEQPEQKKVCKVVSQQACATISYRVNGWPSPVDFQNAHLVVSYTHAPLSIYWMTFTTYTLPERPGDCDSLSIIAMLSKPWLRTSMHFCFISEQSVSPLLCIAHFLLAKVKFRSFQSILREIERAFAATLYTIN